MNAGRKKQSLNKTTPISSGLIADWIIEEMEKLVKQFPILPPEKKFSELRRFSETLMKNVSPQLREEIASKLYTVNEKQLLKMDMYFNHIAQDQKFPECRKLLPLLKQEHILLVGEHLSGKIKTKPSASR